MKEITDLSLTKFMCDKYMSNGNPTKEQQAEINRIDKEYSLASKKNTRLSQCSCKQKKEIRRMIFNGI